MRRLNRWATVVLSSAVVTSAAACGATPPPSPQAGAATPAVPPAAPAHTPFAVAAPLAEKPDFAAQLENIAAAHFGNPVQITNRLLPLAPGAQRTYEGSSVEDGETHQKRHLQTVTDLTKTVLGVRTVVTWDQDFDDGELKESRLGFYAQADNGDVWYFGEYPEEYEEGRVVTSSTWLAGIAGARPGIAMKATADVTSPSYSEGYSAVVPFTDRARTLQVGVHDCVPAGCYDDMIVTEEFNREEPGVSQQVFYAPNVGNTRVRSAGATTEQESLQLVKVAQLDPAGLDTARAEALKLDASGIQRSREAYAQGGPIERPPGK